MVLSLKPFGCMPSTQSDGVQSAVINLYKDIIYLPVETSGEGEINAHSRVQMALGEAKVKAKQEIERVQEETGVTLDDARAYADEHPELKRPLYKVPALQGHRRHRRELPAPCRRAQGRRGVRLDEARRPCGAGALMADPRLYIGLDVGSTTVKAVVVDPVTDEILWQDYQRHETKQPEKCLEFLTHDRDGLPDPARRDPRVHHRLGRRRHRAAHRREVRPGGQRGLAGGREALPRRAARSSSSAARTPRSSSSRKTPRPARRRRSRR